MNLDVGQLDTIFSVHMHSEWQELTGDAAASAPQSCFALIQTARSNDTDPINQPSRSQQDAS